MQTMIRQIPDIFSLEWPSLNLVLNISPFPVVKPVEVTHNPYPTESNMVWVELVKDTYGLFLKENLHQTCPTCGRKLDEK